MLGLRLFVGGNADGYLHRNSLVGGIMCGDLRSDLPAKWEWDLLRRGAAAVAAFANVAKNQL